MKRIYDNDKDGSRQSREQQLENLKLHNSLGDKPGFKHERHYITNGLSWEEIDQIKDITDISG